MFFETTWRSLAECRGDNAHFFFPPNHFERKPEKDMREEAARSLCRRCRVQADCLSFALETEEHHGIWGGLNELERRRVLRRQRMKTA